MTSTSKVAARCLVLLQLTACSLTPTATDLIDAAASSDASTEALAQNPYLLDPPDVPRRAGLEFDRAVSAMERQQWTEAESVLRGVTESWPQLSGPWLNLAIVYLETERLEDAEVSLARAIESNAKNLDAYNHLAALKRDQGQFEAAEILYRQALAIWPQHASSHLNLGVLYDIYMGRFDQAAIHYEAYQSLQDEPDRRVAGWLMDIERRPQMLARSEQEQ